MRQIMQCIKNQKINRFFSVVFVLFVFLIQCGCMDPHEYEPEEPPEKPEPPEAPTILRPESDEEFRSQDKRSVPLNWSPVEGKEYYEIEIDTTAGFTYSHPHDVYAPPTSVYLLCYPPRTTYYFRVRAYSSAWIWYTDWSETRRFYLIPVSADTVF